MKRAYLVAALVILSFVFGLATAQVIFYRLALVLALLLLASYFWVRLNLWGLEVRVERRTLRAQVGDHVTERITITNRSFMPKGWMEVRDLSTMPGHGTGMAVSLPARGFRSWRSQVVAQRRGRFTLGPVQVVSADPFGLFRHQHQFSTTQSLLVYPATVSLPFFRIPAADMPGEGPLRRRTHDVTPHASSVREYVSGDGYRRIHWPTTLRTGRLMVKDFDQGLGSELWLMVDLHRAVQEASGRESTDDLAVTVAASVARKYLAREVPVGLVGYGNQRYFLPAQRGAGQLYALLEELALAKAEGTVPLAQALVGEGRRFNRFTTLVVVTPSVDPGWTSALRSLLERRVRVVAVLVDPASFGRVGSVDAVLEALVGLGVATYVVRRGDDLGRALSHPHRPATVPVPWEGREALV